MTDSDPGESDDAADLAARIDSLETKLDRLGILLVVLIILQLVPSYGGLLAHLFFVALGLSVVGFVTVFLAALGKRL